MDSSAEHTPEAAGEARSPRRLARLALSALIFAAAWTALDLGRRAPADRTDEAEWCAISLAHVRQLLGREPPGTAAQRAAGTLDPNPWKRGIQQTTFGWVNPGGAKLAFGLALAGSGAEELPVETFFTFRRGQPRAVEDAARAAAEPLLPRLRGVVAAAAAAIAVLLFWSASAAFGPAAGALAALAWVAAPLVRTWAWYARPDFLMLAWMCAALAAAALFARAEPKSRGRALGRAAALGALAGLAAGTKLNGALALPFAAAALALAAAGGAGGAPRARAGLALAQIGLACAVSAAVFWLLCPVLWREPGAWRDMLAFWDGHMAYQQERWAGLGGAVAGDLGERAELARARIARDVEPLRALSGLALGLWALPAGLAALAARALGRWPLAVPRAGQRAAASILAWVAVVAAGTTLWLPLDWDRYFFAYLACIALVEAAAFALAIDLARALWARAARRG